MVFFFGFFLVSITQTLSQITSILLATYISPLTNDTNDIQDFVKGCIKMGAPQPSTFDLPTCYLVDNNLHIFYNFVSTAVPAPPESLTATDVGETNVSLKWRPPKDTGGLPLTAYSVERRDKRWGSWIKVESVSKSTLETDVRNLKEGSSYFFRVFAQNEEGISEPCEMKEPVTPCREPGLLKIHPFRVLGSQM